ncbi:DNA-binding MarR family transcriptional regulator [Microbacterium ginsengiterrae]|uniref:DNA-binding MarR family transcriptional regulator n=1 Tax=Microbacterium ginsengiterrae TaxID=546115 RepID=A0A7W9FC88_9MICO|nr:MarR family transcriptional regulator [Microbacterium ginsengiterrae]MBB5743950.1 DNA-binding MarR family transcriptional regulator [Microbacterium ginsengiterrae]
MQRDEIISSIVMSAHALARIAAQEARNDAPAAQWRILTILEKEPGRRVGELARASRATQPGVTRLLGDLERAGLVTRTPDERDSRATVVHITPNGAAALAHWRESFRETLAPRFAGLDADDWAALDRAAEILTAHSIESTTTTGEHE